jgi:DNA-binding response OmpR family regulator
MRVLVLDDDPLTSFTLSRLFAVRAIGVTAVATADAAERALESERFDALLVDSQADHAKGLRLFARARELDAEISLFLIGERAAGAGREDADIYYIEKPWDGFFVVDIVRTRCAGERVPAGQGGAARTQDDRPTVNIKPIRKQPRQARETAAP